MSEEPATIPSTSGAERAYSPHHAGKHVGVGAVPWKGRGQRVGAERVTRLASLVAWGLAAVLVLLLVTLLGLTLRYPLQP